MTENQISGTTIEPNKLKLIERALTDFNMLVMRNQFGGLDQFDFNCIDAIHQLLKKELTVDWQIEKHDRYRFLYIHLLDNGAHINPSRLPSDTHSRHPSDTHWGEITALRARWLHAFEYGYSLALPVDRSTDLRAFRRFMESVLMEVKISHPETLLTSQHQMANEFSFWKANPWTKQLKNSNAIVFTCAHHNVQSDLAKQKNLPLSGLIDLLENFSYSLDQDCLKHTVGRYWINRARGLSWIIPPSLSDFFSRKEVIKPN